MTWEGLSPPYATIVADPPWEYRSSFHGGSPRVSGGFRRVPFSYSTMRLDDIRALPVSDLAAEHAHLYLWTTNRYLRDAFVVAEDWGFSPRQTLVWCKPPRGMGPGGAFVHTTEFVLFCRRGTLKAAERAESTWWQWGRTGHSVKPPAFFDIIERVSPSPRCELFARAPRLGWDHWGHGYEESA